MKNDKIYYDLTRIKDDIEDFRRFGLNDYHHEKYTTQHEGKQICDFMVGIIKNIQELMDNIENNAKEEGSGLFK